MKSLDKLFKLADVFEMKIYAQNAPAGYGNTAQAGDFQHALELANLWKYDNISAMLNPFLDKIGYQSKFDTDIVVDKGGGVKVVVKGADPKNPQVQAFFQQNLAPKISGIFKSNKLAAAETMVVPWLSQAG